ncbi:hypothetical protein M5K25_025960 [Dendrobium thyrsiflorum]|uniref:DC-UbP/UBTD2 N-terminal domain-containing protein n=1 Tax=Dendrobium thyrsiflorum TaxID=117978 RepID=A0ABD0TW41_DENTH
MEKGGMGDNENTKKIQKPKPWKNPQPLAMTDLRRMREEFWDTAPHYGGQKDFLHSIHQLEWGLFDMGIGFPRAQAPVAILDSAGVILANADMTLVYDERGKQLSQLKSAKYELPKYVLSEPTNLIHDKSPSGDDLHK